MNRDGKMTDAQLDQILAAANTELLGHIEDTADPSGPLIAILSGDSRGTLPQDTITPASSQDPTPIEVTALIHIRIRALDLARDLARARAVAVDIERDLTLERDPDHVVLPRARDFARDLALTLYRAHDLDPRRGLPHDLARALNFARSRALALADARSRALARDLAFALPAPLTRAHDLVGDLVQALAAEPVDASGADLSAMKIRHLDALNGIIWTNQTTWPPRIASEVRAHSEEIRPGTYQVRLGELPDRHALVSM